MKVTEANSWIVCFLSDVKAGCCKTESVRLYSVLIFLLALFDDGSGILGLDISFSYSLLVADSYNICAVLLSLNSSLGALTPSENLKKSHIVLFSLPCFSSRSFSSLVLLRLILVDSFSRCDSCSSRSVLILFIRLLFYASCNFYTVAISC